MDVTRALQKLGLNTTEAAIYLYLAQQEPCSGPQIQAALAFQKVPTYRALKALRTRGLIEAFGESRNQRFGALPLAKLLSRYDEQLQELSEARRGLESFMARLSERQDDLYKQKNITIYEGRSGYRLWTQERLRGDVKVIRECGRDDFLHELFPPEEVRGFMEQYIERRVAKGIAMHLLHDSNETLIDYDHSDPAKLKETRTTKLPRELTSFISIFGSRFGFYTKRQGMYMGVIIDDAMLADMLAFFFDSLWQNSKQV